MRFTVENKIFLDGEVITYVVIRKRIKNAYFRFKDGKLVVSVNYLVSDKKIEKMLHDNAKAILKLQVRVKQRSEEKLSYLGNDLDLIIRDDKPKMIGDVIYARSFDEAKNYIYSLALKVFESRLMQVRCNFDDLPDFKLKSRLMKTKWGVCNISSMSVTLNTSLIMKDVHLIDYVLVHELSHFKYMNHSKDFWNYVGEHYPYYKQARKELNY